MMLALGLVLFAAIVGVGLILNHAIARVAFVEVALTNGLAPNPSAGTTVAVQPLRPFDPIEAATELPTDSISLFVSSTCTTCVRLVDDLADPAVALDSELNLYFEQDVPIVARRGTTHERMRPLIERLRVPAMPYVVITVDGEARAHGSVPSANRLDSLMTIAGLSSRLPRHLVEQP